MKPQTLMDAFRHGYRVFVKNRKEKIALLSECHKLGLEWVSGVDALRFIPDEDNICFNYNSRSNCITYGWMHGLCPEISWADLLSTPGRPELLFSY